MFSDLLKTMRQERGVTLAQLASEVGASTGNISDWEAGRSKPGFAALASLSRFFKVPAGVLLGVDESSFTQCTSTVPSLNNERIESRFEIYCDGQPLTDSEADIIAMYRQLPEDDQKETFEYVQFKYSRNLRGEASLYSTYDDTKRARRIAAEEDEKPTSGIA